MIFFQSMRIALVVLLLAALMGGGCSRKAEGPAGDTAAPAPATAAEVGKPMPQYSAKWLDGSQFNLAAERGNVVLLNLWATWCGPCRFEIPELQQMHEKFSAQGFKVIGVSVDEGSANMVKNFVDEQKVTYPVAHDPEGRLAGLFDTTVLPTSVIIDRTGKVVWKSVGIVMQSDQEMMRALQTALQN